MRIISDKKIQQFRRYLKLNKIDTALFLTSEPIHDVNIEYFTGFEQERFSSFSCLLINQKETTLIVSPLTYDQAMEEAEADEIINLADYDKSLTKVLKEKLKKVKVIGVNERLFPLKLYKKFQKLKFQDMNDIILFLRGTKEKKEIERIKKACEITNHGIKFLNKNISNKITEKELTLSLEQYLIKKGADKLAFSTILKSGNESAYIHPYPSFSDEKIKEGLGLVDFGVRYKGYCSDVTLPFAIGNLSSVQRKIIKTVEEAYDNAIESIRMNVPTWKVFDAAEKTIEKNGFKFKHYLGHGLGLELHDVPNISPKPKNKDELKEWKEVKLKDGMIFTIEPGIYELTIGGCRLENDVLITKKGPKMLTESRLISVT